MPPQFLWVTPEVGIQGSAYLSHTTKSAFVIEMSGGGGRGVDYMTTALPRRPGDQPVQADFVSMSLGCCNKAQTGQLQQ